MDRIKLFDRHSTTNSSLMDFIPEVEDMLLLTVLLEVGEAPVILVDIFLIIKTVGAIVQAGILVLLLNLVSIVLIIIFKEGEAFLLSLWRIRSILVEDFHFGHESLFNFYRTF